MQRRQHREQETPPASVARPKQARSEATLRRILEAAETLIAKKRFGAISIPEIAFQAKSSVGGFYGRFKDKDALLRALEERFFRRLSDRVERVVDPELWIDTDLQGLTRGLVHELISAADEERNLMCAILARAASDPELQNETEQFRRDVTRRITPLFARYAHHLRHPDPIMAVDLSVQVAFAVMLRHIAAGGLRAGDRVLSNDRLEAEIARMVLAYLGTADLPEPVENEAARTRDAEPGPSIPRDSS